MAGRPSFLRKVVGYIWRGWTHKYDGQLGKVIGQDHHGNQYWEIPPDPKSGRHRPKRWYTNQVSGHHDPSRVRDVQEGFDIEIPTEWESWLRFRRHDPPSEKQVMQGYALADMKKVRLLLSSARY